MQKAKSPKYILQCFVIRIALYLLKIIKETLLYLLDNTFCNNLCYK